MHLSLSFNHYQHIANFISSNTLSTAPWTVTQQRPEIIPTVNISVSIIKRAVCAIKNIKNIKTITLSYLKNLTIIPVSNIQIKFKFPYFKIYIFYIDLIESGSKQGSYTSVSFHTQVLPSTFKKIRIVLRPMLNIYICKYVNVYICLIIAQKG